MDKKRNKIALIVLAVIAALLVAVIIIAFAFDNAVSNAMKSVLDVILFNILIPLLALSLLICVHELGHYVAARLMKVEIKEFAIGMGPRILSHRSKKTNIIYAIRAVPVGGSLTMAGEDEESVSANAFNKKPVWKRFIVLFAGSFMNLVLGFVIMAIVISGAQTRPFANEDGELYSTKINRFASNASSNASGLEEGDDIVAINGKSMKVQLDLITGIMREGKEPVDITVIRKGEKIVIKGVRFNTTNLDGTIFGIMDFETKAAPKTFTSVVSQSYLYAFSTIDMVWTSLFDMVTGKYGIEEMSGPVGVTQMIGNSAKEATETNSGNSWVLYIIALITMNLGIVNLLPLPALDGGRIIFLLVELVRRKPLKPEHEGYIHLAGFAVLILFIIVVTFNDIMKLVGG